MVTRTYYQNYYQRHKKEIIQKARAWQLTPRGRYYKYSVNAEKRDIAFNITFEQFKQLIFQPCFYCGETDGYIGVDRIDNKIGYEIQNCVPACSLCNMIKGTQEIQEWIEHIKKIVRHLQQHEHLSSCPNCQ